MCRPMQAQFNKGQDDLAEASRCAFAAVLLVQFVGITVGTTTTQVLVLYSGC